MSLRKKLLLILIPIIILLFGLVVFVNYTISKDTLLKRIKYEAESVSTYYACEFSGLIAMAEKIAEGMANTYEVLPNFTDKNIRDIIYKTLQKNPSIYGSTLALIPSETSLGLYSPYYYKSGDQTKYTSLNTPSYDYVNKPWFTKAVKQNKGIWSQPYYDEGGGNKLMITYSVPVVRGGKIKGVATVDVSLDSMIRKLKSLQIGATGYGFIVDKKGHLIAHPMKNLISTESIFNLKDLSKNPDMRRFIGAIHRDKDALLENIKDPFTGKLSCMAVSPITGTNWDLIIVESSTAVFGPLVKYTSITIIASAIVILFLIILIIIIIGNSLSPVSELVKQTENFAQGNFEARLDDKKGILEIRKLSHAFNVMGNAIEDYIEQLFEEQKKREIFLASISHELMTPVTMITGYNDLLKDELDSTQNETVSESLNVIARESKHLNMLIYDLFVVNDIEGVEKQINYGICNIEAIIREEAENIRQRGVPNVISINVAETSPGIQLTVNADRDKLTHCFRHILDNAVKFSPEGGNINISIGFTKKDNIKMINIVFEDHGIGISEDQIKKIFDPFYQVDMSSTRRFEGLGNGLYICRKIIEAHNGKILCESTPGKGSKFYVRLPASQ
ncbi:MAG: cache domain-containing protein [Armatimonadota bacterium]